MTSLEESFKTNWQHLVGRPANRLKVVLAFSGGVDSMSLLDLLMHLPEELQPQVQLAYFNHQLRDDSPIEEAFVQTQAKTYQVPLTVGHWQQPEITSEAAARKARYRFLFTVVANQEADVLLTAHHADDLLETILLKLIRSGAITEFPGLKAQSSVQGYQLWRPLLPFGKQTLRAYAQRRQLGAIEDSTNATDFTPRNRLRHHLIPELKQENPQLLAHTDRFARELISIQELANQQLEADLVKLMIQRLSGGGVKGELGALQLSIDHWQLLWALLWRRYLPQLANPNQRQLQQLSQLAQDPQGHHQLDLGKRWQFRQHYQQFEICQQAPMDEVPATMDETSYQLPLNQWVLTDFGRVGLFEQLPATSAARVVATLRLPFLPNSARLRHPHPGDLLRLANGQRQKLRRRMINQKVPVTKRNRSWLIEAEDHILWVENIYIYKLSNVQETAKIVYVLVKHQ